MPRFKEPQPRLEQYVTPAAVAAQLLWLAHDDGAIADRRVLDLGCGTGTLAVGAAILGARLATGVDVDVPAIRQAQEFATQAGLAAKTWFVAADLASWHPDAKAFDTVVMNPPFGAEAHNRHIDRLFLRRAAEAVAGAHGTAWFLAQERTERFLDPYARELGGRIERVAAWDYPLMATMEHHTDEARVVRVGGYRLGF